MRPLFATGKQNEQTLAQAIPEGTTEIPVANASNYFTEGDHLFISESDGSELEYLGIATSVSTTVVTVARAVSSAKSTGALLWKPVAMFQWEVGRSSPLVRTYNSGVEVQRSVGGVLYSTQVSDPYRMESLFFEQLTRENYQQYEQWVHDVIHDGLDAFTYVDEECVVGVVKLLTPKLVQKERYPRLVSLLVELQYVAEGSYQ